MRWSKTNSRLVSEDGSLTAHVRVSLARVGRVGSDCCCETLGSYSPRDSFLREGLGGQCWGARNAPDE